jgi:PmbA protein
MEPLPRGSKTCQSGLHMANEIPFERHNRDSTFSFLEKILDMSRTSQTEVFLEAESSSLTRFAGNHIHQNVRQSDCQLSIRVIEDGHIGHASSNHFDTASLRETLDWAAHVARSGRMKAEPTEFAGPHEYIPIDNHSRKTEEFSALERAEMARRLIDECSSKGAEAAGAVSNSDSALAIANSNGLRAYHALTDANFTATVSMNGSTGWCNSDSTDVSALEADAMGKRALERAIAGQNPRKLKPGLYTVILEEAPVRDFLDFLAWLGFGAQSFEEGRSFMCGKIDKKITGDSITIADDAFDSHNAGVPFDYEGIPKERVVLIEKGIARAVVYDRAYAARAGKSSTGHALPPQLTYGPLPLNIVMSPGKSDTEQMLRSVKRGLLVSRFWYCRVVDPARTLLTGQTRDGTFLIEDGEIISGVRDMRFNESILESFSRAEMISQTARRVGSTITPVVKIPDFRFTERVGEQ